MAHDERQKLPDLLLEKLLLGEVTPRQAADLRMRLAREPAGQQRLAALGSDNMAILKAHPPSEVAAAVARRLERSGDGPAVTLARWPRWGLALPALAAVGALVLLTRPATRPQANHVLQLENHAQEQDDGVRSKGLQPHLIVYRQGAAGAERLATQAPVHPRDLLQVGYVAAGRPFGVIVSLDGRGAVTQHFPEGSASATLVPERERTLPHAFELDDAPGFERFILVTSRRPVSVRAVLAAAARVARDPQTARTGRLDLGEDMEESSILLNKVQP